MNICRQCGSSPAQAFADAQAVGFEQEFRAGAYTCCQVVTWADEQWLAWAEAACQDGKPADFTRIEVATKPSRTPVRVRSRKRPPK